MDRRTALTAGVLAFLFVAFHLPFFPRSLEDLDSINFALGIRDFDVALHQPHPPGYPLYMLAAKAAHLVIRPEPRALASLSVTAGALSILALLVLFRKLDGSGDRREIPLTATVLAMTSPLVWVTAVRPLSDIVGLAAALGVQAAALGATGPAGLALAGFVAGLGAGVRSQVLWLTVPLLVLAIVRCAWLPRGADGGPFGASGGRLIHVLRSILWPVGAFAAGALIWAVPLVLLTGGPTAYWQAVVNQGAEDLTGVTMLFTTPTPRQMALGLYHALLAPWGAWPLGVAMAAMGAIGVGRLARRSARTLVTLGAAFIPYFAFDLLFQETVTSRYALPLVVPMAYLAAHGAAIFPRRAAATAAVLLASASLAVSAPTLYAYSRMEAPAFRLLAEMRGAEEAIPDALPVIAMHRRAEFDMRRPFRWMGPASPRFDAQLAAPPKHEWLQLVDYWNGGGRRPVWFIADPLRSDLALIAHPAPRTYRWGLPRPVLFGGMRPNEMDWYSIDPPDWYLGEGWAITPESAGVALEDRRDPAAQPIQGWIRRRPVPSTLMIGGRNLAADGASGRVRVDVDGRLVDDALVAPGFFLRMIDVPASDLAAGGGYGTVTVTTDLPRLAVEQFDAKAAGDVVFGYADGWHEQEYNPSTGRLWHWTSERASLRVRSEPRPLRLRLEGETETFGEPSRVVVRAGSRVLADLMAGPLIAIAVDLPADLFERGEATITIETDRTFVPAERRFARTSDRRRLGLKIYDCSIIPSS